VLTTPWLVADVGGTHMRLGLCKEPRAPWRDARTLACSDYPDIDAALAAYLGTTSIRPRAACFAVAGPVRGDEFRFTNSPWAFSAATVKGRFGLERLLVLNDFEALALALPALGPADLAPIGGGTALPNATMALLGPGTGLGVAALIAADEIDGRRVALPGEGGHIGFSPQDVLEIEVLRVLGSPRVSNEMILSGPGLANLYGALAAIEGVSAPRLSPDQVTARGMDGSDPLARRALEVFCAVLGSVAGDVALIYGATGGVFIGGGIAPRLLPMLPASRFRERFEDKHAQHDYVAAMPTSVIVAPTPALLGCIEKLRQAGT